MAEGQGRSSGQGVKLLYIRDYLYAQATKEHPKNANHIVAFLASHGISATPKTIYNDILRLQVDFGVPVEYDHHKWGYYITTPQFEPYELRLMVDSVQASKFITQKESDKITKKIKGLADVYTKASLERRAIVPDRVRSMNESVVSDADRIHEAIAAYEDDMFFEILAQELALRDMEGDLVTKENYEDLKCRVDEYLGEFERHGTDNITVDFDA